MVQAKKISSGEKVRYAAVGLGWITQGYFLPGVEHTGNSELVALVSGREEKADEVAKKYGQLKTYNYEQFGEMLSSGEVDAVYLATPNFDHTALAVQTLEAGVHLLLEKPMATSVADCERITAAARASGAKLMIAYRLHFEPGTLKAIEQVRAGKIGTPRFFNSSFAQPVSGQNHRAKHGFWAGPVPDMGPYPINAVRNLFGAEPIEVFATGVQTSERFNFDDTVAVTLKFEKNRVASFVLSYNAGDIDDFRIVGETGDLFSKPAYQVGGAMAHELTVEKKTSSESFKKTDHFGGETKYFSECVIDGTDPEPDGEEGMLDVRVLEAVERALKTGQIQRLEPYHRKRRPMPEQEQRLGSVKEPELVGAHKPSDGQ